MEEVLTNYSSCDRDLISVVILVRSFLIIALGGNATDESVNLMLYNNRANATLIPREDLSQIDPNKETLLVFHGFRAEWKDFDEICRLHIQNDSSIQVINVDWKKLSGGINYIAAVKNAETVGNYIANVLKEAGLHGNKIRMMGFSLGAHSAGFAAKYFTKITDETIKEIVGIDPAGPMYSFKMDLPLPHNLRLAQSDAKIVVTLKTNRGLYGAINDFGHINFYANNAVQQPGCEKFDILCSHYYAVRIYTKSILEPQYLGIQFQHWSSNNTPVGLNANDTLWFLENVSIPKTGLYHIITSES